MKINQETGYRVSPIFATIIQKKVNGEKLNPIQKVVHEFAKRLFGSYKTDLANFKNWKQYEVDFFGNNQKDLISFSNWEHYKVNLKNIPTTQNPLVEINKYLNVADIGELDKASEDFSPDLKDKVNEYIEMYKKIKDEYLIDWPLLIKELGGLDAVNNLPFLDINNKFKGEAFFFRPAEMKAPVMRGFDKSGRPFIAICYAYKDENGDVQVQASTIFQRERSLKRVWTDSNFERNINSFLPEPQVTSISLNRLGRLLTGKPVGKMNNTTYEDHVNKTTPNDAYLEDIGIETHYYELKINEGDETFMVLWDPTETDEVNEAKFKSTTMD